ncbi:MAG: GDP-mannose 4,6-dehydratase [Verrucomicrobia bacterium]|nr:GDP-mannose 4,6-dehydratase [Verrucomicrobiota bacterium]MCH8514007.1 GDP-mannose 4,6-dehydratase [Kiritimatiellia bacterium]
MPRILITGANGFVGKHAVREFRAHDYEVFEGLGPSGTPRHDHQVPFNLLHYEIIRFLVDQLKPDACLHLAGQAHIPFCREDPVTANDLNVTGTVRLLEAFRRHRPQARIVIVTSAEVYGQVPSGDLVTEKHPLTPTTLYGITKQAADEASLAFADQLDLQVMTARPWNHIGPGQHPRFVAAAFARQFAEFTRGAPAKMKTGNLDSQRDFTDVRDIVRGYRLLVERGEPGEAYNLSSSTLRPIRALLEGFSACSGIIPETEVDPALFRPTDASPLLSTDKIRESCGWTPQIPLEQSLRDILDEQIQ